MITLWSQFPELMGKIKHISKMVPLSLYDTGGKSLPGEPKLSLKATPAK